MIKIHHKVERDLAVLYALAHEGPMTLDQFVQSRTLYVASWSGIFTWLRQEGLIRRTGEMRLTVHNCEAHVVEITDAGRVYLRDTP